MSKKSVLVVGAGGFIGGFIVKRGLELGYDVWAGVRESTSRRYLADGRIKFAVFDYDNPSVLQQQLAEQAPEGGWQYIIYNLGATKCANFNDFNRINYVYPVNFCQGLEAAGIMPERFLFMSSLSALGNADYMGYEPMTENTPAHPNTRYGLSKIKTETWLESHPAVPWIIFRPTGVYGPHEKDYLMMIKSIDARFDFGVGYRKQVLSFIYVSDLVQAMYDALRSDKTLHRKYIISEPQVYTQAEFRKIVARALGKRFVLPVKLPLWMGYVASVVAEKWGAIRLKPSTLNRDKFKIMRQRNWNCSVDRAVADFGFHADYPLERGIAETVKAYLEEKKKK